MRSSLVCLLVASACTSPTRSELDGTWERIDADGNVLERITFDSNGEYTATSTQAGSTVPREGWRDLRETYGSYLISGDTVRLRGHTADDVRCDLDFTFYVDDAIFVRGAFIEYEDEDANDLVRHFHSHHSAVYSGMPDDALSRTLDIDLALTNAGGYGPYGMSYEDPVLGGADGDSGTWRPTDDGALVFERSYNDMTYSTRYEVLGAGGVLGKVDTRPSSLDVPNNVGDTAFIFARVE